MRYNRLVDAPSMYFLVRDDARPAAILAVLPFNTYEAYNTWGGKSLYANGSVGPQTLTGDARAVKVSFNRPYDVGVIWPESRDLQMVRFLEKNGYDVGYASDADLDRDGTNLLKHRVVLVIGHDEYWSRSMRSAAERARDRGVNLAFLGGNDVYRQVRYEPDASGNDRRTLVCFKSAALDPVSLTDPADTTTDFMKRPVNEPENALTGTLFDNGDYPPKGTAWRLTSIAPAWLIAVTQLHPGDSIPNLEFYECDRAADNGYQPPVLLVVGTSSFTTSAGAQECDSTYYVARSGTQVFSAGTMGWMYYLSDPRVSRMTRNLLDRFSGSARSNR